MHRLIGFVGKPNSGKSTAAKYIASEYLYQHINVGDSIKDMLAAFYRCRGATQMDITRRLHGDLKEQPDQFLNGKSPRHALQTLGKEWRDTISTTLFADCWEDRIKNAGPVVADGMRYADEMAGFKRQGGILAQIVRPNGEVDTTGHVAETLQLEPDIVLVNDGTLYQLYRHIDYIFANTRVE